MTGVPATFFEEFEKLSFLVDMMRYEQAFDKEESGRMFSATISICDAIYALNYGDSEVQDEG